MTPQIEEILNRHLAACLAPREPKRIERIRETADELARALWGGDKKRDAAEMLEIIDGVYVGNRLIDTRPGRLSFWRRAWLAVRKAVKFGL